MPEPEAVITNSVLSGFIEFAVRMLALWLLKRSHPGPDVTNELLEKWNRKMLVAMHNTQGDMIVAYLASNIAVMMQVLMMPFLADWFVAVLDLASKMIW